MALSGCVVHAPYQCPCCVQPSVLATRVQGVWLYLDLAVDRSIHEIMAWAVAGREDAEVAVDLISRTCRRERTSRQRQRRLDLHAHNGAPMRSATVGVRLEDLGVLRWFSRLRISNDNPYSEGSGICELVQRGASPERHQVCNTGAAARRPVHYHL